MAVDLVRVSDSIIMTGGATWDAIATLPTSQVPNSSSLFLDVVVHGSFGYYIEEGGVVARFQSVLRKDSGGTISQLGAIHTIKKFEAFTIGGEAFAIRNTISGGSSIVVEVSGLINGVILTFDVTLRSL